MYIHLEKLHMILFGRVSSRSFKRLNWHFVYLVVWCEDIQANVDCYVKRLGPLQHALDRIPIRDVALPPYCKSEPIQGLDKTQVITIIRGLQRVEASEAIGVEPNLPNFTLSSTEMLALGFLKFYLYQTLDPTTRVQKNRPLRGNCVFARNT